jgi:CBS domain containing-hemolysin-like protein
VRFWGALLGAGALVFILTDLLPKTLFRQFPNRLCLSFLWLFRVVHLVLAPLVRLVERFAALLLFLTRGRTQTGRLFGNRDELRALLHESGGALIPGERALINRVLDAQNVTLARVTTPLAELPRLTTRSPVSEFLAAAREHHWDRLPVWDADPLQARVRGVVTLRRVLHEPVGDDAPCGGFLSPAAFLPDSLRLDEALRRMQRGGSQAAVVLGPDGGERGFVTFDTLLHTLFGEVAP